MSVVENMNLTTEEAAELIKDLQRKFRLLSVSGKSEPERPPECNQAYSPPTQQVCTAVPLEVLYEDGDCLKQAIVGKKPIGVVFAATRFLGFPGHRLVLYWKEFVTTDKTEVENLKQQLPQGYRWHVPSTSECKAFQQVVGQVNKTLTAIGGDCLSYNSYATLDNPPYYGYTRYVAIVD